MPENMRIGPFLVYSGGMSFWLGLRVVSLAAGAVASVAAVRSAARSSVTGATETALEEALELARIEIKEKTRAILADGFRRFLVTTGVKLAVLAVLICGVLIFEPSQTLVISGLGILLCLFAAFDIYRNYPVLVAVAKLLRTYGFRPMLILKRTVAVTVFAEVIERAAETKPKLRERLVTAVAGQKRQAITQELATQVSRLAAETSFRDIRPIVAAFMAKCVLVAGLYAGSVYLALSNLGILISG